MSFVWDTRSRTWLLFFKRVIINLYFLDRILSYPQTKRKCDYKITTSWYHHYKWLMMHAGTFHCRLEERAASCITAVTQMACHVLYPFKSSQIFNHPCFFLSCCYLSAVSLPFSITIFRFSMMFKQVCTYYIILYLYI